MAVDDAVESMLSIGIIEFRDRNYEAEASAHSLPRSAVDTHPLATTPPFSLQVDVIDEEKGDTLDPLTATHNILDVLIKASEISQNASEPGISYGNSIELIGKEWTTFKRFLVQRFPDSKMVSVSSISNLMVGSHRAYEKLSSLHLEELDDPQGSADEDAKFITQQEYIARLIDMKNEITSAWHADDYFKSLKLSVKVARLLRDTALLQFYPMVFSLVTEILDMLGDMVWERIKQKAEFSEDGLRICSLPEDFQASDVCSDAKETCHNWFCKIGSIHELLPRIYLELAVLPCWRFLHEGSSDVLQRLVKMMRGLGDPLASAYCHLYLAYCAQKMAPSDKGYLITCLTDISFVMTPIISPKETTDDLSNVRKHMLIRLMEPPVEYIMKCIFKDPHQQLSKTLVELGLGSNQSQLFSKDSCVSVILHHLLKELPPDVISSNAVDILDLIEGSSDASFDQCMNFRLLGFRLYEKDPPVDVVNVVLDRIIEVVRQYQNLDAYLKVVDGYVDILLQNQMTSQLEILLEGIADRACIKWIIDSELESLQSIFVKILTHTKCLKDVLKLNHFVEIVDIMRGSPRNVINMRILDMATRNSYIDCASTIQFLFEVCRDLHDGINSSNMLDSDNQPLHHLLSRFVQMVDFGIEWERHLAFLVDCRGAFASADELKETLVHRANCLAIKDLQYSKQFSFVRSCLAFCEATIPSVSTPAKQLILYLETAEVALTSGLVCHSDGLIDSAMSCLESLVVLNDSLVPLDVDRITSIMQKLCSLVIMVPGNPWRGVVYIPRTLLSIVNSQSRWMTTRIKVRTLCAIISLLATLAQNKLPYHARGMEKVLGNDHLFFDDPSYHEELASLCGCILQNVVHALKREASLVARGSLVREVCTCIALSLKMNDSILHVSNELMEIAKSCMSTQHGDVLSTSKLLAKTLHIAPLPIGSYLQQ